MENYETPWCTIFFPYVEEGLLASSWDDGHADLGEGDEIDL